ncbi:hypothetical protein ACT17_05950 [Mycolicibacterium conceptionense]|uniref:Uncharacterized protein n=1 Tax=Mycolicibacterium conceptionense TaxID=451644 RepID=A0A0J8UF92_9MYCO|nr:hypothetical protein [Mycolicibacterium conceptionense]KMV19592.1 hypothetical protein ACT17_05950 [Mycolicibacterium conceptionense]
MYVIREGFFGGHEVGYYRPDGEWERHTGGLSERAADELVNRLNGGNATSTREHMDRLEEMERAREDAELRVQQQRWAAAEQESANLAAQAQLGESERARWLAAQEEDRQRARAEAYEELRRYPPRELRGVGGLSGWDGVVDFRRKTGETISIPVTAIV